MSTIQDLFLQSQLAEAAYADFSSPNLTVKQALQNEGFSDQQATDFLTHWRYVDQFTDSGLLFGDGSGFSATLFECLDANGNGTGQYTFAIRGSQLWVDFTNADLSLATGGVAFDQLLSMVNYVLRLDVGSTGQTAQLEGIQAGFPPVWTPVWSGAMVQGEGPGISLNNLTVTGHSLGGALAQMFQRIFGSDGVYTYNTLGVDGPNAPIFDQLTTLLGLPSGSFSSGVGGNLVVPGEPANNFGIIKGDQQQQIFTESANQDPYHAHKIGYITDSLAVYNLFANSTPR